MIISDISSQMFNIFDFASTDMKKYLEEKKQNQKPIRVYQLFDMYEKKYNVEGYSTPDAKFEFFKHFSEAVVSGTRAQYESPEVMMKIVAEQMKPFMFLSENLKNLDTMSDEEFEDFSKEMNKMVSGV